MPQPDALAGDVLLKPARKHAFPTESGEMRTLYRVSRWVCMYAAMLLFRIRVFGREHVPLRGGVLLLSNHQSFFDPPLLTLALPRECHFMARDTLFRGSFAKLIRTYNAYPIKRGSSDMTGIKETIRRLRNGALVTAFPEGTRTEDGSIGPMHAGTALLARRGKVPIVPAVVLGADRAWPKGAKAPKLVNIVIAYGEAIPAEQVATSDDETLMQQVRARIFALFERYRGHPLLTD